MTELRRELGLFEATVYGVGLILGAGIYAILGEAAGAAGGSVVISFVLAATIAALTGLSYAELSARFPKEEGDYLYVREAFADRRIAEVTALLRLLVGVISAAAVALAFGGYLAAFAAISVVPAALAIVGMMALVNFWGIAFSARLNVLFTVIEVIGLLLIIALGVGSFGRVQPLDMPAGGAGIVRGAFLIFFAYIGFGSIVNVSEETADASRTIPRAIVLAIAITTVLYVLVGAAAVALVSPAALGASDSPLALVARAGMGPGAAAVVAAIALFSTTNTVLILEVSTSRLLYGVSKTEYEFFPPWLAAVHSGRQTPYRAVAAIGVLTGAFVLLGDLALVAGLANLLLLVVFVLVNAALIKLRVDHPVPETGFRVPLAVGRIPVTAVGGLVSCLALAVFYVLDGL